MSTKQDAVRKFLESTEQTKQLQRAASDSVGTVSRVVNKTFQPVIHITDTHDNEKFFRLLKLANMLGALVIFGGDLTNNQILSPHADPYADIRNPDDQLRFLDMKLTEAEEQGIDLSDITFMVVDGNHEYRLTKSTSLRSTRWIMEKHGLGDAYAANRMFGTLQFKPDDKRLNHIVTLVAEHGDRNSSNSGRNVTQNLQSPQARAVDGKFTGHTHQPNFGNQEVYYTDDKGNKISKTIHAINFGSMQEESEYADRAGYRPAAILNDEVLLISVSLDKKTNKPVSHFELINARDILTPELLKLHTYFNSKCKRIEKDQTILTEEQARLAYDSLRGEAAQKLAKMFRAKQQPDNEFYFDTVSGILTGREDLTNETLVKDFVGSLSKKSNAHIAITGNMFDVAVQLTKEAQQTPEIIDKLFSDMYTSAKMVKPIANSIIGYHYNSTEIRLASNDYQTLLHAIVKKAMKTFQMDESLAFKPMKEQPTEQIEQFVFKEQSKKVYEANSSKLEKVLVPKYLKDAKFMELFADHMKKKFKKVGYNTATKEKEFKLCLSDYLNKNRDKISQEDWLLQMDLDRDEINKKFPIDTTGLMVLHENAVSNVFLTMMGLKPEQIKEIKVKKNVNQPVIYTLPMRSQNGEKKTIKVHVQASNSVAGRTASENYMNRNESNFIACDMYVISAAKSEEFSTKTRISYVDSNGKLKYKDAWHIAAASLTGPSKYVNNAESKPRIYKGIILDKDNMIMESLDPQGGITDFFDMQVNCINRLISQSVERTTKAINARNQIKVSYDENLLTKLTTKKIKEAKEAEKVKAARIQQKVISEPVEETELETTEEDALKVG